MNLTWIKLTSTDGRPMVVRADQIVFMAEHPEREEVRGGNPLPLRIPAYTDIVLECGERGKCRETMEEVISMLKRGLS